jgi:hypothetical protein
VDRSSVLAWACAAYVAWSPASASPNDGLAATTNSDGGTFRLELQPSTVPVPVNELFELQVTVRLLRELEDPNPFWLALETAMPGHGHGMNTRARVEPAGDGRFVVRGLLLHMSGQWEFAFDVAKGRTHEKAIVRFELE